MQNDKISLGGFAPGHLFEGGWGGGGGGVHVSKRGVHVSGAFFFLGCVT